MVARVPSDWPVRLVLHPGHPKCGSSSIQHALRANAEPLRTRGVLLPARRPNRMFIRSCATRRYGPVEEWIVALVDEARAVSCDTVVVSSENLGVRQLVGAGRPLHEIFARHFEPVDVIYYLRRQDDWMVSMWQQWGHKRGQNLSEFVDDRLGFNEPDYLAATKLFEGIYGSDRVVAVPIHKSALLQGNLVTDFARRAGVGALPVEDAEYRNPSMSGFLCSVLARIPHVYDQGRVAVVAEGRTDHSVREILKPHVAQELLFNRDKRVLPVADRRRIMAHFEADNRALHARYFAHVPFDDVFGLPEPDGAEALDGLRDRVDGLENVVAMQMDVILELLAERQTRSVRKRTRRRLGGVRRWLKRVGVPLRDRGRG